MNIILFSDQRMYPAMLALINSIIHNNNSKLQLHLFVENDKFLTKSTKGSWYRYNKI